jgi:sugar phosphate isomerase/epimerase
MKNPTRRQFLGTAATLISGSLLGANQLLKAPAYIPNLLKPNSLIKGVQIGVITYSFRDLPDQSIEATLQYILDCGINATELMGDPAEIFAGRPKNPVDMRSVFPLMRKRFEKKELTAEEKVRLAEVDAQMSLYNQEVAKWRTTMDMNKFTQVRKMFKKAGVKIYAFKPGAFGINNSDAEIEYGMKAAKLLGANQVTVEHPNEDAHTLKLGKMAEKYKLKMAYHGHEQQTPVMWDKALAQSSGNGMNLDLGHYIAAGNKDALELIQKKHQHITSMHIKDRQNPEHGKGNLVWGMGDTPIVDALRLMRDQKYKFPATIELEYKVPEGSTSVKEVQKCLEFCRKALI